MVSAVLIDILRRKIISGEMAEMQEERMSKANDKKVGKINVPRDTDCMKQ